MSFCFSYYSLDPPICMRGVCDMRSDFDCVGDHNLEDPGRIVYESDEGGFVVRNHFFSHHSFPMKGLLPIYIDPR